MNLSIVTINIFRSSKYQILSVLCIPNFRRCNFTWAQDTLLTTASRVYPLSPAMHRGCFFCCIRCLLRARCFGSRQHLVPLGKMYFESISKCEFFLEKIIQMYIRLHFMFATIFAKKHILLRYLSKENIFSAPKKDF